MDKYHGRDSWSIKMELKILDNGLSTREKKWGRELTNIQFIGFK